MFCIDIYIFFVAGICLFLFCIFIVAAYVLICVLAQSVFFTDLFLLLTCSLVSSVIRVMGDVFTELREHEKKITEIIKEEEASFCKTLAKVRAGFNFCKTF